MSGISGKSVILGKIGVRKDKAQMFRTLDKNTYKSWFHWISYAKKHNLKAHGELYDPSWGIK